VAHALSPAEARMLYAVADALLPPAPGAPGFDWVPAVEAALARRANADAQRLRRLLRRLDLAPLLAGRGGRFWALPRAVRAARLAALRAEDHRLLRELLADAHSTSVA
jgi:hypothetical protein